MMTPMLSFERTLLVVLVAVSFGCSASQPSDATSPAGSGAPVQSASVGGATAPTGSTTESVAPAVSVSATVPAAVSVEPGRGGVPLAHTVSSAAGDPPTAFTAVPGAAPTPDELNVIAMCLGQKSMFTEKELKLLKLADTSGRDDLRENADAIRQRRQDQLKEACLRLKAEGKLK